MTRALLKAGSDALKPDNSGQTALHYAIATPDNGLNDAFLDDGGHFDEMVSIFVMCGPQDLLDRLLSGSPDS